MDTTCSRRRPDRIDQQRKSGKPNLRMSTTGKSTRSMGKLGMEFTCGYAVFRAL